MPTYRGVTVSLQSQYDAVTIPEYLPSTSGSPNLEHKDDYQSQHRQSSNARNVDLLIPTYPSSQFWISYRCRVPQPRAPGWADVRFYYFKLYVSGRCVLSWGVGEDDNWSGKTVFGLFDAGTDFGGKKIVEMRGLFFPGTNEKLHAGSGFEIRVFRAKARKREDAMYDAYESLGTGKNGLKLSTVSRKKKGERQRFYTYALVDAKDEPYVTFKYEFCAREQFDTLDHTDADDYDFQEPMSNKNLLESSSSWGDLDHATPSPMLESAGSMRRLSVPPRKQLTPTTTQKEPSSPVKKGTTDGCGSQRRAWTIRTPSPDGSRNRLPSPGTPPSQRKAVTSGLLRSVVASALKRKEVKGR
ncbi:hypothetical protein LTR37_001771 [Vermiconidia calcicola]|uniref:Uncharacterized protein n=1 Tax=Vermiconidia calcicola TaxID=1690605 RepID=A0ACC3NWG2_9PEZI|nr:hypothetical protein LTR37_001771 [Vermiconidia calcicola]